MIKKQIIDLKKMFFFLEKLFAFRELPVFVRNFALDFQLSQHQENIFGIVQKYEQHVNKICGTAADAYTRASD